MNMVWGDSKHHVSGMDDEVVRMNCIHESVIFLTYGQRTQTNPPPKLREVIEIADIIRNYVETGEQPDWDTIRKKAQDA